MDDYPKSVTKKRTLIIFNQMNNSLYKIQGKDNKLGVGIFCKIKIKNKIILVLMTNYDLIDEQYIEKNIGFKILINNEMNFIKFGDKRLNYINNKNNLSVIEIKDNKKFKINFLEIDESLYEEKSQIINNKETIYSIYYNKKEKEILVSYGIIKYINKFKFSFFCNINSNETLAPIFNLNNNKLIGIYNNNTSKYFIKGLFLKIIINKFTDIIRIHKDILEVKNEIDILIKIYKEDINKEIYFLNNNFKDNNNHDNLNELNTELYINEKL